LWLSDSGPLYSTLVPVGGLRLAGYLEVIVDPAFNLQDIGDLTRTPISVLSATGESVDSPPEAASDQRLPVEYVLAASSGEPAFRIVGYEDVSRLSETMRRTQVVTTSGFLLLTLITLLSALWLFNRFFLRPLGRMVEGMGAIAAGELDLPVDKRGLKEFSELARSFESMASQVKIRTGDLERLLDLDDSAILCFGHAGEAVYFNKGAMALFGYADDEIGELELADLFRVDIARLVKNRRPPSDSNPENALSHTLDCVRKDGGVFRCEAVINPLDVMGGFGYTIVLSPVPETRRAPLASQVAMSMERNEQRMRAIEQSLNSILEIADNNPGLVQGGGQPQQSPGGGEAPVDDRQRLRVQAVEVMRHALTCWEHDLGRTKLALAEESRIWPVYIDKSTPTTRTLDKYLHTDSCPRNPRSQRVVDTAEFVLRSMDRKTTVCRKRLQQALDEYRRLLSGGARR
jgi:PAS domain S-box-containing protein